MALVEAKYPSDRSPDKESLLNAGSAVVEISKFAVERITDGTIRGLHALRNTALFLESPVYGGEVNPLYSAFTAEEVETQGSLITWIDEQTAGVTAINLVGEFQARVAERLARVLAHNIDMRKPDIKRAGIIAYHLTKSKTQSKGD